MIRLVRLLPSPKGRMSKERICSLPREQILSFESNSVAGGLRNISLHVRVASLRRITKKHKGD